jgi:hypothetical protein
VLGGTGQIKIEEQNEGHKIGKKTISIHETINFNRRFTNKIIPQEV